MRPVGAGHLTAQPGGWDHFPGIRDAVGIEGLAHAVEDLEVAFGEHRRHRARLVDADAVLAGE
jgi:hypothetical protein